MPNSLYGGPFELSLGAALTQVGPNRLDPLRQHLLSGWLGELTSRPAPSDVINQRERQAAANQPQNGDYSTVLPQYQQPGAQFQTPFHPQTNFTPNSSPANNYDISHQLDALRQRAGLPPSTPMQPGNGGLPRPGQITVLHGDPTRRAPAYPGGIGPDANQVGYMISTVGPGPNALYQIFRATYNDRSNENVLPSALPLREIAPEAQGQIQRWMLLTDSDMSQKFSQFGGRDLRPQPGKNPGHVYAVGLNANGRPVDVLDFYWNQNNMTYFGQYVINYFNDNRGNLHTHVSDYTATYETRYPGPQRTIGDSQNTYMGASEYISTANGTPLAMVHYSNLDSRNPDLGFNFSQNGATMFWRDTTSGQTRQQNMNVAQTEQAISAQAGKFDFEHLFGPK